MPIYEKYQGNGWSQTIIKLGPFKAWWNSREDDRMPMDPALSIHWGPKRVIWLRFGRHGWRNFFERYQGQHGIPIHWRYYLGGRISIQVGDY